MDVFVTAGPWCTDQIGVHVVTSTKRYRVAVTGGVAAVLAGAIGLSPVAANASTVSSDRVAARVAPWCGQGIYEVRTYTFATAAAAQAYLGVWAKHVVSLKAFGIQTLKYELAPNTEGLQVRALVAYPPGSDPAVLDAVYRASAQLKADMAGFDVSQFRGVQSRLVSRPSFD